MKVLILSFCLIIILVSCVNNHNVELNDLAYNNLNGSVRSVVWEKYSVNKRNKHLNLSSERLYNDNGYTVDSQVKWNFHERLLDSNAQIKINLSKAVSFDELGKPIEFERFRIEGTDTAYLGTRQIKKNKEIDLNEKDELSLETFYTFDSNSRINTSETKLINKNQSSLKLGKFEEVQTTYYFWDDRYYYFVRETNKSIPDTTIYRMNDNLDVISFGGIKNGEEYTYETYSYKYDTEGNWIEKVGMQDGVVNSFEHRQIEYFRIK